MVHEFIAAAIDRSGVSRAEIGRRVGLSPSRLGNYLSGSRKFPLEVAINISRELGISLDELVTGSVPVAFSALAKQKLGLPPEISDELVIAIIHSLAKDGNTIARVLAVAHEREALYQDVLDKLDQHAAYLAAKDKKEPSE